jgi:hypothetical protein
MNLFFKIVFVLMILFITWHLGRWYENQDTNNKLYQTDSITKDAYNYYILIKCLKENSIK